MLLGSSWKSKLINQDTGILNDFKDDYIDVEESINEKTKDIETITTELANHLDTEFTRIIDVFKKMAEAFGVEFNVDGITKPTNAGKAASEEDKSSGGVLSKLFDKVKDKVSDLISGSSIYNETLEDNNTNLKTSSDTQKTNTDAVKNNETSVKDNSTCIKSNSDYINDNSDELDDNSSTIETLITTIDDATIKIADAAKTVASAKESKDEDDDSGSSSSGSSIGKVIGKVIGGIGKVIGGLTKHHSGGIIGNTSDKPKALFELANQKLKSDEEVIIGQSGELVLTKEQQSNIVSRLNAMSDYNQTLFSSLSSNLGNYTGYLPNNLNVPTGVVSDYSVNGNSNKNVVPHKTIHIENVNFSDIGEFREIQEALLTIDKYVEQNSTSGYNR